MRIDSKKYKGLLVTLVGVIFLLTIGITYAYFSLVVKGNNSANNTVVTSGTLEITYAETNTVTASNILPGWSSSNKVVTITNTGTQNATYSLLWDTLTNEFSNNELLMSLSCTSTGNACSSKDIPVTVNGTTYTYSNNAVIPSSGSNINIQTDFVIEPNKTQTLTLKFYFKETGENQNYNQGASFTGKLKVGDKAIVPTPANTIVADLVENPVTINYKQPSSSTNGEGLFKYTKLTSPLISGESNVIDNPTGIGHEDIYYYRGNITNNNVILGGYCWLIVRTTDTGGTKLLYNGPVQTGTTKCPSYRTTSSDLPLMDTGERWDSTDPYTDVRYEGSRPKSVLDNWYSTWITNNPEIEDKLESIVWCNDVNNQTLLENDGDYPAETRLYTNSTATPQLECKYEADRYISKIGLLTADEGVLAGQAVYVTDNNENSYINIASKTWWLGSPYGYDDGCGFVFYSNGVSAYLNGSYVVGTSGVRGSVSLSPSVSVTSGTGTPTDPYIVE